MKNDLLETIELEMAILGRRITSLTFKQRKKYLDRAAYLLLLFLFSHGSAGVKTIATGLQLDISTASRQASSLSKKGYIEKIPDPKDRRAYNYQITELGTKKLIEYKKVRMEKIKHILSNWSEEECQTFGKLLKKFNEDLWKKL